MATYKCTASFADTKGKRYSSGDEIDSATYDALRLGEQTNFRKKDDSFSPLSNPANYAMGDMLGSGLPGGYDLDITTPW